MIGRRCCDGAEEVGNKEMDIWGMTESRPKIRFVLTAIK